MIVSQQPRNQGHRRVSPQMFRCFSARRHPNKRNDVDN
jgi:hypothetical protein